MNTTSAITAARKMPLRSAGLCQVLPLLIFLAVPALQAGLIETFDDGNPSDWHLTTAPAVIEPDGGNPGPYLHATADAAVPTWYVPTGTPSTPFLGDYVSENVGSMSFDINVFAGISTPPRNVTLDLNTTLGTGDFSKGVDAYYIGRNITNLPVGWHTYAFPIDATSPTIPQGWVVTRGDGTPGTDADWQALMQDVETIGVELGTPGYFYPFWIWDLGLDNCRIAHKIKP